MRARRIQPEFFTDKKIARLGVHAALVFEALWCWADDGGTAECEAVLLKGQAFMRWEEITVEVITTAILGLTTEGLLRLYRVGDREFAIIRNWAKYQPIHNPAKFRYPPPSKAVAGEDWPDLTEGGGSPTEDFGSPTHPYIPTSLHPDIPTSQHPNSARARRDGAQAAPEFEEVWEAYPKRAGGDSKADALAAFNARVKSGENPAAMLAGVRRYATFCDATGKVGTEYVKQARTFLGRSRHYLESWDLPPTKTSPSKRSAPGEYDYSHPTESAEKLKWQ